MQVTSGDNNSSFENELPPAGSCACRCIRVVDLGTQENDYDKDNIKLQRQVSLTWELAELMESGKPFAISEIYTASINEKANLGKLLTAWRGKPFTDDEKASFELDKLLGVAGLMSVTHKVNKKGDTKEKVGGIIPLPKGMSAPDQVNDPFLFEITDIDEETKLKELWGLERFIIAKSEEFKMSGNAMPEREKKQDSNIVTESDEDSIPF